MAFTGLLGSIDSTLGNIILGANTIFTGTLYNETASNTLVLTQAVSRQQVVISSLTFVGTATTINSKPASNTLSFGQNVNLALIVGANVANTLSLTQPVSREYTHNESVSNTLAFTQTLKRLLEYSVSNTLVLTQIAIGVRGKVADNTLTLTHDVDFEHPYGRSVSNTIAFSHSVNRGKVNVEEASNILVLSHNVKLLWERSVANTITFSQNAYVVASKTASNTLALTHDIDVEYYKLRKVFATVPLTHTLDLDTVLERSVANTITFSQVLTRVLEYSVSNTLTLSQDETHTNSKYVANTIVFDQTVVLARAYVRIVASNISLNENLELKRVVTKRMQSRVQLLQNGRVIHIHNMSVAQNINFTQDLVRERFEDATTDFFTLVQDVDYKKLISLNVTQNINFTHAHARPVTYNFNLSNTLVFLPIRQRPITIGDLTQISIPNVIYSLHQRSDYITTTPTERRRRQYMTISVPERTVLLPVPLFGDREGNTDLFTMSHAIDGTIYTTIKRSSTRNINFEWDVSYPKGEELAEFIWDYNTRAMRIETWNGEIWIVRLVTNPVTFTDSLRPSLCESDSKINVALDFEGVRIH